MTSVIESIESISKETSDTSAPKSKKREYKFHSRRNRENVIKEYSTPKKEIQEEQKQIEENSIENLLIQGKFKPKEIIEEIKKNEESIKKDDDIIEEEVEVTIKEEKKTFTNKNSRRRERLKSKEKDKEIKESKDVIIEEVKTKEDSEKKNIEPEKKLIEKKTIKEIKYKTTTSTITNIIKKIPASSKEFISEIYNEINNLRSNPKKYNNELQYYEDNAKLSYGFKPNIQKDILKLINKIRNSNNIERLQKNDKLTEIAEQYLQELRFSKGSKFYPKDQEVLLSDLNSEFNNVKFCKNYVCTNPDPKKGIFDLLFNEKDLLNGTSDRFLNQEAKFIGIAHDKIRNLQVTIIIVSDTNIQIQKEKLFDGLLNELNKARNNPQMYLKFISQDNENYQKILYAKKVCSLEYNYLIEKACEERGKKFDEENTFYNRNELNNFLSQFGKNYFIIQEYINNSTLTAKDFVINMFQNENINQILLNRRIKQVGFSQSPNGKVVLIFTDCFDRNLEKNEISIGSLRRKLFRPNLTEDEILQIKNDFNLFDSRSEGIIKPNLLLLIANTCNNWGNDNPFYYTALKELNNEENNKKGVTFEHFLSTVKRVIRDYSRDDFENNWEEIFNLYFGDGKKNIINNEILSQVIKDLGFQISDDEVNEFVDRMEGELDLTKFIQIMKEVELSNFRK